MTRIEELRKPALPDAWPLPYKKDPRVRYLPDIIDTLQHILDCCSRKDKCIGAHPSELVPMLRELADGIEMLTDTSLPVGDDRE